MERHGPRLYRGGRYALPSDTPVEAYSVAGPLVDELGRDLSPTPKGREEFAPLISLFIEAVIFVLIPIVFLKNELIGVELQLPM